jgi:hypothetical protein
MATHKLRFFQYMEVAAWLAQINKSKDSVMAYGQVSGLSFLFAFFLFFGSSHRETLKYLKRSYVRIY